MVQSDRKILTFEDFSRAKEFTAAVAAFGDAPVAVDAKIYEYFFGDMPPAAYGTEALEKAVGAWESENLCGPYQSGYMSGDPASHNSKGEALYHTFFRDKEGQGYYAGKFTAE